MLYFAGHHRRRFDIHRTADHYRHANARIDADDRFLEDETRRLFVPSQRSQPRRRRPRPKEHTTPKGTHSCLLLPYIFLFLSLALPPPLSLSLRGCETTVRWFWCLVLRPAIYLTNRPSTAVISPFLGFPPI